MVGTHIFIFYCFKQHTHKVENKHIQSDSAAWPKCTVNTDTHNQNSAGLALAEGTPVLAMGCGSFQCHSMGSKTPLTTTILQRVSTAGSCLPLLSFYNMCRDQSQIYLYQKLFHAGTSGQVYTSVLNPVFLTSYFNGINCLLW